MMDGTGPLPQRALRSPDKVMSLAHLGQMQPTRLSFLRVLMRNLASLSAVVTRPVWDMTEEGYGQAVYTVTLGDHAYSLIAFSQELAPENRSDRVIATEWDVAFVLFDGVPQRSDIERLKHEVPHQEAGRLTEKELVLSRANKSVRLFDHVVQALRAGRQPDAEMLAKTGYLMRTTAVYGNGKFGLADRTAFCERPCLSGPFAVEMLTVWLIRGFTHDLVEHVGGGVLDRRLKRYLGVGNATGLGMAPFLVSHPLLLDAWMTVRETALARVLEQPLLTRDQAECLVALAERAQLYLASWEVADTEAMADITALRADWAALTRILDADALCEPNALAALFERAQAGSAALEELTVAWLLEPFGNLVDDLAALQATPTEPALDAAMPCAALREMIEASCGWAIETNFEAPEAAHQFWYVSEEKLEPRLGTRATEPGADLETPLDSARQIGALHAALPDDGTPLWPFLAAHPEHRAVARRVQALGTHPYAEVRANLLGAEAAPIHLLRSKLSMFGATRFDPKSKLWTRVTLSQGLPLFDEIGKDATWLPTI